MEKITWDLILHVQGGPIGFLGYVVLICVGQLKKGLLVFSRANGTFT